MTDPTPDVASETNEAIRRAADLVLACSVDRDREQLRQGIRKLALDEDALFCAFIVHLLLELWSTACSTASTSATTHDERSRSSCSPSTPTSTRPAIADLAGDQS